MRTKNEITGDALVTKPASDAYRDGWDRIFGKKKEVEAEVVPEFIPEVTKPNKPKKAAPKGLHVSTDSRAKSKG